MTGSAKISHLLHLNTVYLWTYSFTSMCVVIAYRSSSYILRCTGSSQHLESTHWQQPHEIVIITLPSQMSKWGAMNLINLSGITQASRWYSWVSYSSNLISKSTSLTVTFWREKKMFDARTNYEQYGKQEQSWHFLVLGPNEHQMQKTFFFPSERLKKKKGVNIQLLLISTFWEFNCFFLYLLLDHNHHLHNFFKMEMLLMSHFSFHLFMCTFGFCTSGKRSRGQTPVLQHGDCRQDTARSFWVPHKCLTLKFPKNANHAYYFSTITIR